MDTLKERESKHDDLFGAILQEEGKMEPFFGHLFSFLFRRTDFYITMKNPTDKMGFTPGRAEMIVREAFKKYETLAKARELRAQQPPRQSTQSNENTSKLPPTQQQERGKVEVGKDVAPLCESAVTSPQNSRSITPADDSGVMGSSPEVPPRDTEDTYNGGVTDKYRWSQTLTELDVLVDLPAGSKAKDVTVVIDNTHLKISVNMLQEEIVLIGGELPHKVLTDSSIWMVESRVIRISLEKAKERMWGHVFVGEEEIDLTKVEAIKEMEDLDSESHAAVNRVMFDQHQKMQGKPQSHELETYGLLEKAWDAEGSPFKGTAFDPSKVSIAIHMGYVPGNYREWQIREQRLRLMGKPGLGS